jgi:4-coumarate--CoA ligase
VFVHESPLPSVEIPDVSLTEYVLANAAAQGDKPALIDGPTGRVLTYTQLDDQVRRLAGGLVEHGLRPGDVVALMAPNIPEYAVVFHAVVYAGCAITTFNGTYTEREVHHQLVDSRAKLLITVEPFLEVARAGVIDTNVSDILLIGAQAQDAAALTEWFGEPLTQQVPVTAESLAALPYSSGTTGINTGVMLTHRNLIANVAQTSAGAGMRGDEVFIAVLPFFHIYGMQVLMNCGLHIGATVVTMPRFDLAEFLQLHQQYGITRSFVAPPIVVALAKHPLVDQYDMSAVEQVFSGAAPLSAELALEAGARLGCEVVQGYGMTEMSPVSHLTTPGGFKPGSVGVTAPSTATRIVDPESGEDLDVDLDGEIWVRGPQVMPGYLNNESAPRCLDAMVGCTGIGLDGHLFVVDRLKELIKVKGFQVAPAELEALLLTHPAVADAAVVGRQDDRAGEVPVAFVVLKAGQEVSEADLKKFVADQVAHYKQIDSITFTETMQSSGKILRRLLRDSLAL